MEKYSIFMNLDEKDKRILGILTEDSSLTTSKISKKTRIPITTIHNRIQKLKKHRIIKSYTLNLNYEKLGRPITAYILLTVNQNLTTGKKTSQQHIAKKIKAHRYVDTVDIVTGATDMIIKVRTDSMGTLNNLLTKDLRKIDGVDKTQTMIVLEEI
ncbi:winged helix-turn-helix transcriptional regulator [Candidatus Woesearchaeota archaeon]|nr:winged helix-turn-helix transcriptional regulator [Candidatus Woesearchaeota archaeon]